MGIERKVGGPLDDLITDETPLTPEEQEALERAIRELPPKARMALILLWEDRLGYEAIAAQLRVEPYVARRLVFRALEYLLECVDRVGKKPTMRH
jgi:RNA polymerase sigma factor (sigma-70 family)